MLHTFGDCEKLITFGNYVFFTSNYYIGCYVKHLIGSGSNLKFLNATLGCVQILMFDVTFEILCYRKHYYKLVDLRIIKRLNTIMVHRL